MPATIDLLRTDRVGDTFNMEIAEKIAAVIPILFPHNVGFVVRCPRAAENAQCPYRVSVFSACHSVWRGYVYIRKSKYMTGH